MIGGRVEWCADCAKLALHREDMPGYEWPPGLEWVPRCAATKQPKHPGSIADRCVSFEPVHATERG